MKSLASRLAAGDESAYAEFYDAFADKLYRFLRYRLGTHEAANEVLQETFLRMIKHQRRLKKAKNLESYVFQIARNEANRWLGRKKPTVSLGDQPIVDETPDTTQRIETAEQMDLALARLDDLSREIIQLKVYGELTFKSIAETLNLPPGTVATRYRRAIDRLRGILEQEDFDE